MRYLVVDLNDSKTFSLGSGECGIYEGKSPEEALTKCLQEWGWTEGDADRHFVIPVDNLPVYFVRSAKAFDISVIESRASVAKSRSKK